METPWSRENFRFRLRSLLDRKGLEGRQVCRMVGIGENCISDWLNRSDPPPAKLAMVAHALRADPGELLYGAPAKAAVEHIKEATDLLRAASAIEPAPEPEAFAVVTPLEVLLDVRANLMQLQGAALASSLAYRKCKRAGMNVSALIDALKAGQDVGFERRA